MAEKRVRWTIVDMLIILVILAAMVVGVLYLANNRGGKSTQNKVEFVVLISGKDMGFGESISAGDSVTLSLTEKDRGIVKNVDVKTAESMVFNSITGEYTNELLEGYEDIYVTIEADCDISEQAIKTGSTAIKVGAEIPVRGKGYATSGFVIDINEGGEVQ